MKFAYNPRILKQLGTELITSDAIAITELIKNSYDARAKNIGIHFCDSLNTIDKSNLRFPIPKEVSELMEKSNVQDLIVIEDDGIGMDETIIRDGFFVVGTTLKRDEKHSLNGSGSILLGDKGIGRLSSQRLRPMLVLESTSEKDNHIHLIKVDWEKFISDKNAESQDYELKKDNKVSYTRLWLFSEVSSDIGFENYFEEKEVEGYDLFGGAIISEEPKLYVRDELQQSLSFLFSPFSTNKPIININLWNNSRRINLNFHIETFKVAETIHSFDVNETSNGEYELRFNLKIQPWFLQRIHRKLLGKKLYQDWEKDPNEYGKLFEKYRDHFNVSLSRCFNLKDLKFDSTFEDGLKKVSLTFDDFVYNISRITPISGKVFSFKRDAQLLNMALQSALAHDLISDKSSINDVRTFLNANNGIKLYRNKFRIGTIGNKEDDWLKLQQERTKGQQFYRFELGNVIGYVDLNDPKQEYISETSSRQQVNDNLHYRCLFVLLDYIFNHKYYDFNRYASEIAKNIFEEEDLLPTNTVDQIKQQAERTEDVIKAAQANIKAFQKAFTVIDKHIELDSPQSIDVVKNVLTSIHKETQNFQDNFSDTLLSLKATQDILKVAEREKSEIEIEAYNNYKLMANGLITEVITHELHSLVNTKQNSDKIYGHFEEIKEFLIDTERFDLNKKHLYPLKTSYDNLTENISDIGKFYQFLEKTFLYKGTIDDYEVENLEGFINGFVSRFEERFNRNKIKINLVDANIDLSVPRGSLIHLFYNLIDNSIAWIKERKKRADYDSNYQIEEDYINITVVSNDIIQYSDSGTGILNQFQHTLFNPFVSGKNGGRGMGLYIIRRFLESFGASIILRPELNSYGNRYIFEISFNNKQE
jgi:signal transduction histidine kinase